MGLIHIPCTEKYLPSGKRKKTPFLSKKNTLRKDRCMKYILNIYAMVFVRVCLVCVQNNFHLSEI